MAADSGGNPANRGPWIIGGAILVAAVLIAGTLFYTRPQDSEAAAAACAAWQAKVHEDAKEMGIHESLGFNKDDRPEACDPPSGDGGGDSDGELLREATPTPLRSD